MTNEQKVPPGFGRGKSWKLRAQDINAPDGTSETLMIFNGMPVFEQLHGFYWHERESYRKLLAQVAKLGEKITFFAILNPDNRCVGTGSLDPSDGPDELAWLSCMVAERGLGRIAFDVPTGIDMSAISPTAKLYGVVDGEVQP